MNSGYELILYRYGSEMLTLEDLAKAAGVHPELIEIYVESGLLEPVEAGSERLFETGAIRRLRTIQRLRREVGVGLPGIAIILDLTERIETLQREVAWLRVRLD
jgi:DNA-binding transcriptional MerR regulator